MNDCRLETRGLFSIHNSYRLFKKQTFVQIKLFQFNCRENFLLKAFFGEVGGAGATGVF